jgi:hypothetical protein
MADAFQMFKKSSTAIKVVDKYRDVPFLQMLDEIRSGDKDAFLYAIYQSMPVIIKVFNMVIVNRRGYTRNSYTELAHDYFNDLLIYLYEITDKGYGPFFKFNPDTFVETDDEFLMNKLRYYVYRYAMILAKRLNDSTVDSSTLEVSPPSLEGGSDYFDTVATPVKAPERSQISDPTREAFLQWLVVNRPKSAQFLVLLDQGVDAKTIMATLNISSRQGYHQYISSIKKYYDRFIQDTGDQ